MTQMLEMRNLVEQLNDLQKHPLFTLLRQKNKPRDSLILVKSGSPLIFFVNKKLESHSIGRQALLNEIYFKPNLKRKCA